MKHFLSMANTFRAMVEGRIRTEELRSAQLVFGPHRDAIHSDAAVPIFVLLHNVEKPKFHAEAEYVDHGSLDAPVLEEWKKFKLIVREADRDNRVTWTDGKNYPQKAKPLLQAGHEVYFDGRWMDPSELKYLEE